MKKQSLLLPILLTLTMASCVPLVHLYETKPMANVTNQEDYFENDTIKVIYSFWSEHGTFSFSIYNKLNVPIYIDWKKSSFIKNNDKLNYWNDETLTKTVSKGGSRSTVSYSGYSLLTSIGGISNSTSVKPEQITFIAPKSTIYKIQFKLHPEEDKRFRVDSIEYNESNTPVFFRNFMTLSTSDKFEKEFYIDNGFYVSKISEMLASHFCGGALYLIDDNIKMMKSETPFKRKSRFYIIMR